ncbi:MAG: hypothetical protein AAFX94_22965, partial [Myxococcota bacterium]
MPTNGYAQEGMATLVMRWGLLGGLLLANPSAYAQGLKGLGPPGGLSGATPEVLALESGLLA